MKKNYINPKISKLNISLSPNKNNFNKKILEKYKALNIKSNQSSIASDPIKDESMTSMKKKNFSISLIENNLNKNSIKSSSFYNKVNKKFNKPQRSGSVININRGPKTLFEKLCSDLERMKSDTENVIQILKSNTKTTNLHKENTKTGNNQNKKDNKIFISETNYIKHIKPNRVFSTKFEQKIILPECNNNEANLTNTTKIHKSMKKLNNIPSLFLPNSSQILFKELYHKRNLIIDTTKLFDKAYNIYSDRQILFRSIAYIKDNKLQINNIISKVKLILNNLEHFRNKYMNSDNFINAFNNLQNIQKANFNLLLEELSIILLKIIPIMLKEFYDSFQDMIYVEIPNIKLELEKTPFDENECLTMNYHFFNEVIDYFISNIEVCKILYNRNDKFSYKRDEYSHLLLLLDLARYDSSYLTSTALNSINKMNEDIKLFDIFEKPITKLKKNNEKYIDELERYHERHKIIETNEKNKINRINSVINIDKNNSSKEINEKIKRIKIKNKKSIFTSPIFINMLKYFKPKIKSEIMAEQIIARYKERDEKKLKNTSIHINILA